MTVCRDNVSAGVGTSAMEVIVFPSYKTVGTGMVIVRNITMEPANASVHTVVFMTY